MANSSYYSLFIEQNTDRLDENFNSPRFNVIYDLIKKSRFKEIVPIGNKERDNIILKNITSGKTPRDIEYLGEGIPFLGASNIRFYDIDFQSVPKISIEDHENKLKSSKIRKGNLLISMAGTIGHCAVYDKNEECNCNQAVAILELDQNRIMPEYLMYYLNSEIGQLFFHKFQHVCDQPNINLEEIKRILVIIPGKDIQKSIIKNCLIPHKKIVDKEIELNRLKNNFDMPMRDILNKNPKKYDNVFKSNYYYIMPTELENVRERIDFIANHPQFDWIRKFRESKNIIPLSSIIDNKRFSYGLSKSALDSGEIGFLNVQHLSFEGRIVFEPTTYLSECPEDKKLLENDILIARTGHTLGKSALITEEYEGFTFGSFCIRFSLTSKDYLPDFVAQFINSIYGQAQIMILKAGSGKNNINLDHISDIRIPIIGKDVQKDVLKKYSDSLKDLSKLETDIENLNKQINKEISLELYNN